MTSLCLSVRSITVNICLLLAVLLLVLLRSNMEERERPRPLPHTDLHFTNVFTTVTSGRKSSQGQPCTSHISVSQFYSASTVDSILNTSVQVQANRLASFQIENGRIVNSSSHWSETPDKSSSVIPGGFPNTDTKRKSETLSTGSLKTDHSVDLKRSRSDADVSVGSVRFT